MPLYLFKNPRTGSVVQIFQFMEEEHKYSENGIEYERVFTVPNASVDSQINPDSATQFIEKTGKMKGTMGEIWDYSKELSDKRAKIHGEDPVKRKAEKAYSKKRKGMKYKEKINSSEIPKVQLD